MNERRRLLKEYIRDDADEELDYFTIMPYTEGESYVSSIYPYGYYVKMNDGTEYYGDLWYSIDGGEWTLVNEGKSIDVPCFSKIRFKGNWHEVMKDVEYTDVYSNIEQFLTPVFYSASASDWWLLDGTPLSLIHGDNFTEKKNDWNYYWDNFFDMFYDNYNIAQINNPKTFLPSTELNVGCYESMFEYSNIQNAPELPAETLQEACYYRMFAQCRKLEETPALNAKTLVPYCYYQMFASCSNLRYAKVTAKEGFDEAYSMDGMFYNCPDYGLVVLSQELIDAGFDFDFNVSHWEILTEDYPTNEQGYPEAKGTIEDYDILCLNAEFYARYEEDGSKVNYFYAEANELRKELFDYVRYGLNYKEWYNREYIFINRCKISYVIWFDYEYDGEIIEQVQFSDTNSNMNWIGHLFSDGSMTFSKKEDIIYDYIKK